MTRAALAGCFAVAWASLVLALPVGAHHPDAKSVARAAAKGNRDAGRSRPVELEVALFAAGAEQAEGQGRALLDPGGRSRVEISGRGGVERQRYSEGRRDASRDGALDGNARVRGPPLHLLQADSGGALQAGLSALGGRAGHVELGHDGAHDAWVLGGRDGAPAVWIDTESHLIFRIDWGSTRARLVWPSPASEARWPARIELESDRAAPIRLEIRGEKPAQIPADAFSPAWLTR